MLQYTPNIALERCMGFLSDIGWYCGGSFLIFFAFTRMLKLKFGLWSEKILTAKFATAVSIGFIYAPYFGLCGNHLISKELSYVKSTRRSIGNNQAQESMRKKEIKLFMQCFVNSLFFCMGSAIYFASDLVQNSVCTLGAFMHYNWILNHTNAPIVYFCLNAEIRKKFWSLITCHLG
uniref:7TM GPCR serpentine receptor class x (Srx) domain-containing protein n=1 Tax=Romanomermis culicivorax TaxID=13658 RepID=A0A915HKJ5_ROMCU